MPAHDPIALGLSLPLWSVLPFAGLLLAIALFPLVSPSIWVRHYGKVCLAFGLPVAGYFLLYDPGTLLHTALEYVSFLVLLASLFTISGGILLRGTLRGPAGVNCAILAVGAVLANLFGTTGASMLLIRPLLRANAHRKRKAHVVLFFIFVVANIGGALTPIGDPPLFLGYLRGVPFFWTLRAMGLLWGVACALVIGIFYLVDRRGPALAAGADDGPRAGGAGAGGGGGGDANGGGPVGPAPAGDQRGRGLHGGEFVHRQRPQLHGEGDRGGGRDPDALLPRLHGPVLRHPPPHLRPPHPRILLTPEPGQPQTRDVPRTPPKVGHSRTSFPPLIATDSPLRGTVRPRGGG